MEPTNEPNEPSKRCKKCGVVKPATAFYRAKHCLYGRRSDCKKCSNKISAAWRRAQYQPKTGRRNCMDGTSPSALYLKRRRELGTLRERMQREVDAGQKNCRTCQVTKVIGDYRTNPHNGFPNASCKECERGWSRAYKKRVRENKKREAAERQVPTD